MQTASTPLQRLSSAKLVEQTVAVLREQIVSGNFTAGGPLPSQGELCVELGVSRSVIREAMRTLQSQGLIEVSQGRRPTVLPAGPAAAIETLSTLVERSQVSLLQLLEVRQPLEVEIAAKANKARITPRNASSRRRPLAERIWGHTRRRSKRD